MEVAVTGNNSPSFAAMVIHHIQPKPPHLHHQHSSGETKSLSVLRYIYTFLSFIPPGVKPRTPGHVMHRHKTELKDGSHVLAKTKRERSDQHIGQHRATDCLPLSATIVEAPLIWATKMFHFRLSRKLLKFPLIRVSLLIFFIVPKMTTLQCNFKLQHIKVLCL